jgi:hypothetical protein
MAGHGADDLHQNPVEHSALLQYLAKKARWAVFFLDDPIWFRGRGLVRGQERMPIAVAPA